MSRCRVYPPGPPAEPNILRALGDLTAALLSDQLDRTGGLAGIRPIADLDGRIVVGRAFTVKSRAGDNLVIHKAADLAEAGDFLVIDAGGDVNRAVIGEIWCRYAASRGVIGVAVSGATRDADSVRRLDMPVFAQGITHQGPYKDGPGEVRGPIAIGDTVIRCGDYVVGDGDGVVIVPADRAAEVVASARRRLALEEQMMRDIAAGTLDRSWLASLTLDYVDGEASLVSEVT